MSALDGKETSMLVNYRVKISDEEILELDTQTSISGFPIIETKFSMLKSNVHERELGVGHAILIDSMAFTMKTTFAKPVLFWR